MFKHISKSFNFAIEFFLFNIFAIYECVQNNSLKYAYALVIKQVALLL